ncbi:MAG: hypothetical protein LBE38_03825 [Deltaproteobacteria bacterium]|jgi:hypothetical protein|nr:hypothetical protein [Deltaproteobacteria bacterium]
MRYIRALILSFFLVPFVAFFCEPIALAQNALPPVPQGPTEPMQIPLADSPAGREQVHLAALGTYSAGFVLEAYGYIGVLADVLHYGVYEPEIVRSMLGETQVFLEKSLEKLKVYQDKTITVSEEDLKYINGIADILKNLILEAQSLQAYCQSFDKADFDKFKDSRAKAWAGIKQQLGIK